MDPIEKAIRNAFEKGDDEDRTFREKVYRQAFAALDRALQANPGLTVESAMNRRKLLQSKIAEIESEYIPAVAVEPRAPEPSIDVEPRAVAPVVSLDAAPVVSVGQTLPRQAEPRAPEPSIEGPRRDPLAGPVELRMEPGAAPDVPAPEPTIDEEFAAMPPIEGIDPRAEFGPPGTASHDNSAVAADPDVERARRGRRRPYALLFIAATLVAALGMGLWFAYQTGLFMSPAERDTSVPNPPATIGAEDFIPENEAPPVLSSEPESDRDWIGIFMPEDATEVSAPTDATAQALEDESGSYLRIKSGASGAAVVFDVGQGVLEKIAGKKATFDIVARAGDGKDSEMSVDCNFGELGDCGRKRYLVGYERADFLFEVTLPATRPGAGGTIAINSDFSGSGKHVDIYEIKVSVAP